MLISPALGALYRIQKNALADKKQERSPAGFLVAETGAAALCALMTAMAVLFPGLSAEGRLIGSISTARLIGAAVPLVAFGAAVAVLIYTLGGRAKAARLSALLARAVHVKQRAEWLGWTLVAGGLVAALLPSSYFGENAAYYLQLRPLLIWIGSLGIQVMTAIWYTHQEQVRRDANTRLVELLPVLRHAGWILLGLVVLGALMLAAIRGVRTYEDYRYEPGVPILILQAAAAVLAGTGFRRTVERRPFGNSAKLDRTIFVLIWITAAFYWASLPIPSSYMNPAPLPPNHEVYPTSDSAQYDLQAQAALLGLGLGSGRGVDNPLYPALLFFVHLLSGQDFESNMRVQAALLAVLPALAYVVGKQLHSRSLGIAAAIMVVFHGANTIAASGIINTSSPKQMLTDFPTAIGVGLVMVSALELAVRRDHSASGWLWHGASVAIAFLVRPTALSLLAMAPIVAAFSRGPFVRWLRTSVLALGAFGLFLAPWGIRSATRGYNPFAQYLAKLELITTTRYDDTESPRPQEASTPEIESPSRREPEKPRPRPLRREEKADVTSILTFHIANNVMGSVLILPTSPMLLDLRQQLHAPDSVWSRSWNGSLGAGQIGWLGVSAAVLAIGGAGLWKRRGLAATIPVLIFVLYQLANSAGRTSGGRYIVPVDWIVLIYFAAGLLIIFESGTVAGQTLPAASEGKAPASPRAVVAALICILLLGSGPLIADAAVPAHFAPDGNAQASVDSTARDALLSAGYSAREVDSYMRSGKSIRLWGRAFYPRWFSYRAIARGTEGGLEGVAFPSLQFWLLGPRGILETMYLFSTTEVQLANAHDVIVLGCREGRSQHIEALAVLDLESGVGPVLRSNLDEFRCGLPQPVCDQNANCN